MDWRATFGAQDNNIETMMAAKALQQKGIASVANFLEQQKQTQADEALKQAQLDAIVESRRATQAETKRNNNLQDEDRTERVKGQNDKVFFDTLKLRPKGSTLAPEEVKDFTSRHLSGMIKLNPDGSAVYTGVQGPDDTEDVFSVDQMGRPTKTGTVPKGSHFVQQPKPEDNVDLSPDAETMAATIYARGGGLPPRLSHKQQQQILDRAAKLGVDGAPPDVMGNKADYTADSASQKKLQSTLDNMTAFKSASEKNSEQLRSVLGKMPDSGVPWLNKPLRELNESVVGAEYAPAIRAAQKIYAREVARITTNPGGIGGVLSDNARHEVDSMINTETATLPQILHALDVMHADLNNTVGSYNEQLTTIKGRTHAPGSKPAGPKSAADIYKQYGITVK